MKMVFLVIMDKVIDHLVDASKGKRASEHHGTRGPPATIDREDIVALISLLVDVCASRAETIGERFHNKAQNNQLTEKEYARIRHALSFNPQRLFETLNEGLEASVKVILFLGVFVVIFTRPFPFVLFVVVLLFSLQVTLSLMNL